MDEVRALSEGDATDQDFYSVSGQEVRAFKIIWGVYII
jgi:hypothetical protein